MEFSGAEPGPPQYALVSYIPEALGRFLNGMRCELVPSCRLLSHVTVLPPRVLNDPVSVLVEALDVALREIPPFEVGLGPVMRFPVTDVVYIAVAEGRDELERVHGRLNQGALAATEPFHFHPHVTLAQEVEPDRIEDTFRSATTQWTEWPGERSFPVERLTFVRNGGGEGWVTVAEFDLAGQPSPR
jgi:2'-5' RNA ligase